MKKLAVFDIDGTIFRSSLFIELVEGLITKEAIPASERQGYAREYERWLNRKGSYEDYLGAMIRVFSRNLKGIDYNVFSEVGKQVVKVNRDRTYKFTRDLVLRLKKKGYFMLAISQSPKGILDDFCKRLGFDKIYGRFYELGPQDKFTGEVTDLHLIANKANIVKRVVAREGLTLKGSYAVGDTEGDIPMLELVENPICFNPNAKLYKFAKLNKWRVVVERKDVIYDIPII